MIGFFFSSSSSRLVVVIRLLSAFSLERARWIVSRGNMCVVVDEYACADSTERGEL